MLVLSLTFLPDKEKYSCQDSVLFCQWRISLSSKTVSAEAEGKSTLPCSCLDFTDCVMVVFVLYFSVFFVTCMFCFTQSYQIAMFQMENVINPAPGIQHQRTLIL